MAMFELKLSSSSASRSFSISSGRLARQEADTSSTPGSTTAAAIRCSKASARVTQ